jgi:hypothetical protein
VSVILFFNTNRRGGNPASRGRKVTVLDTTTDTMNETTTETAAETTPAGPRPIRLGRSETPFPYVHLEECTTIPRALFERGARELSRDQLAGALGASPGSGSFSLKLGAARMFGLIDSNDGKYQLTETGHLACSADTVEMQTGRRDAFLAVDLYKRLFTDYKGKPLPPAPKGLEAALISYGVAPKQADKCRQALMRSAAFAGFLSGGRDRLIEPIISAHSPVAMADFARRTLDDLVEAPAKKREPDMTGDLPALGDKLIRGLLERLPPPGKPWPKNRRDQWLKLLPDVLAMVYPDEPGKDGAANE